MKRNATIDALGCVRSLIYTAFFLRMEISDAQFPFLNEFSFACSNYGFTNFLAVPMSATFNFCIPTGNMMINRSCSAGKLEIIV